MHIVRTAAMAFFAVLAVSFAVTASAFAATNNPDYSSELKGVLGLLEAGEKGEVEAKAANTQSLKATGVTINCTNLKLAPGANIKGRAAKSGESEGTSEEILEYSGCTVESFPECKVEDTVTKKPGTIKTLTLTNKLAWKTKEAAEKENLEEAVTVFEPKTPSLFVTLNLSGTCPLTGEEKTIGTVIVNNVKPGNVGKEIQTLEAPSPRLAAYWLNVKGVATETKPKLLELGTAGKATYAGTSEVKLTTKGLWGGMVK